MTTYKQLVADHEEYLAGQRENAVAASEPVAWAIVNRNGVAMDVRMTRSEACEHAIGGDTLRPLVFAEKAHRVERAERVVERINGIRLSPLCCDGENNAEVDAYHDGFNAAMEEVRDAIRALEAEEQP